MAANCPNTEIEIAAMPSTCLLETKSCELCLCFVPTYIE